MLYNFPGLETRRTNCPFRKVAVTCYKPLLPDSNKVKLLSHISKEAVIQNNIFILYRVMVINNIIVNNKVGLFYGILSLLNHNILSTNTLHDLNNRSV